jgi:hypothetical protein
MNDAVINAIQAFTLQARADLEREAHEQLEGLYGWLPDGTFAPEHRYPALALPEARDTRARLERIQKLRGQQINAEFDIWFGELSEKDKKTISPNFEAGTAAARKNVLYREGPGAAAIGHEQLHADPVALGIEEHPPARLLLRLGFALRFRKGTHLRRRS